MASNITIRVLGDASAFSKSIRGVETDLKGFADKATRAGRKISLAITAPLALVARSSFNAASSLQQSVGAVESVFGSAGAAIFAFGDTAAKTAGLSKREVNEMAARVGASLQGVGFSSTEAAKQVITLEKRAADLAATFGGTTAQAIDAIAAVLRGERDPIERFGVAIKEADVSARILALGLDTSTAASTANAKAVANLSLLMEQSANSEGQFNRERDSAAGKMAIARKEFENTAAVLGEKLLPIGIKVAGWATDLAEAFAGLSSGTQTAVLAFGGVAAAIGPLTGAIGNVAKVVKLLRSEWVLAHSTMLIGLGAAGLAVGVVAASVLYLNKKLNETKVAAQEAGKTFAQEFAAAFTGSEEEKVAGIRAKIAELEKDLERSQLRSSIERTKAVIKELNKILGDLKGKQDAQSEAARIAAAAGIKLGDVFVEDGKAAQDLATRLSSLRSSLFGLVSAKKAQQAAERGVADAQEGVVRAQKTLNDLLRQGAVDTRAVAAAEKELEQAHRGVTDAQRAIVDAQQELDDARKPATPRDLRDAELDLVEAQKALERSELRIYQATEKRGEMIRSKTKPSVNELRDATLDITDAENAELRAEMALRDAQDRLNEVRGIGGPTTDAVTEAERRLEEATRNLRDSQDSARQSQENLDTARAGDPEHTDKIAEARRGLRDAEYQVITAQEGAREATWRLFEAQEAVNRSAWGGVDAIAAIRREIDDAVKKYPELAAWGKEVLAGLPKMTPEMGAFIAGVHLGILPGNAPFPKFHSGGVVPGRPGQEVPIMAMAGERVGWGGGISVGQIVIQGSSDPKATARAVREELLRLKRNNGDLGLN